MFGLPQQPDNVKPSWPPNIVALVPISDLPSITERVCLRFDGYLLTYAFPDEGTVEVLEHYGVACANDQSNLVLRGHIKEEEGSFTTTSLPLWERRSNFKGVTLTAGAVIKYPGVFESTSSSTEQSSHYDGYLIEILALLQASLNFRLRLVVPPDGQFGVLVNGSWSGAMGLLVDGSVDFNAAFITMTLERAQAVDFSHSTKTGIVTLLRAAGKSPPLAPSPASW